MLGLPDQVTACLFDLDGVLTDTAAVHDAAWKKMFDSFLQARAQRTGEPFVPFDSDKDYGEYVDGRPRADGVRAFLKSRDIELPEGSPDDGPDAETVNGLGNRKNVLLLRRIETDGVKVFEDARTYLKAVRDAGPAPRRRRAPTPLMCSGSPGSTKFVQGRVDGGGPARGAAS